MPRASSDHDDNGYQFLQKALSSMKDDNEAIVNSDSVSVLNDIVKFYQPSFREIERMLSYFSIINNMLGSTRYLINYQYMIAMVCYLKACHPNCLKPVRGQLDSHNIIESARLDEIGSSELYYSLEYINKLVRFDLADEGIRQSMLEEKEIQIDRPGRPPKNLLKTINSWLSEINPS